MQSYKLEILGLDISFKADTDPERLEQARQMLEERFDILRQHGRHISKEKLLVFLSLALADDMIQLQTENKQWKEKAKSIQMKLEKGLQK